MVLNYYWRSGLKYTSCTYYLTPKLLLLELQVAREFKRIAAQTEIVLSLHQKTFNLVAIV